MNTQHTPGPWIVFNCQRTPTVESTHSIMDVNDIVLACTVEDSDENSGDIAKANAALIAAAPELLAALQLSLSQISEIRYHGQYFEDGLLAQLRAAILKAGVGDE